MASATQNLKLKVGREARVRFAVTDAAGVPVNIGEIAAAVRLSDCDSVQLSCVALDAEAGLFQVLFPSFPSPAMGGWELAITTAGIMRVYCFPETKDLRKREVKNLLKLPPKLGGD